MTAPGQSGRTARAGPGRARPMLVAGLIVGAGVLLLAIANAHLIYVAVTSQPECVPHLKGGETAAGTGSFRAAKPSC